MKFVKNLTIKNNKKKGKHWWGNCVHVKNRLKKWTEIETVRGAWSLLWPSCLIGPGSLSLSLKTCLLHLPWSAPSPPQHSDLALMTRSSTTLWLRVVTALPLVFLFFVCLSEESQTCPRWPLDVGNSNTQERLCFMKLTYHNIYIFLIW